MDGGEPDVMLARRLRRNGGERTGWNALQGQPNGRRNRLEPVQDHLNQQHQHRGLASIRRQVFVCRLGIPFSLFRWRRLDLGGAPATLRSSTGFAGKAPPKRHRPLSAAMGALLSGVLNFPFNQALT